MSGGGGKASKATSNQSSAPWTAQQPYLTKLFSAADKQTFDSSGNVKTKAYYPGSTYAGMAPESAEALTGTADRARAGSDVLRGAQGFATDVLGGKYLSQDNPNFQAVAGRARDAVNANYGGWGRSNSGLHDRAVADSVGNLAYQDYANQLNLMNSVAGQAPGLAQADYNDLNALNQVGQHRQGEAQNQTNADIDRYNYDNNAALQALQDYQDFINGNFGGSSQTTTPYYSPPAWQGLLGTGLQAAGTAAGAYFGAS